MFSTKIVGSDAFLDMPISSREFYFQLGMYADDDGFVQPRKVMRMVGASEDDFKMLVAKRFVLLFENGVVVVKHWRMNNQIRLDRYSPTEYQEQKNSLLVKENGAYSLSEGEPFGTLATTRQPNGNQLATQYSIGKDSIGKVNTIQANSIELPEWLDSEKWNEWVSYRKSRRLTNNETTLNKQIKMLSDFKSQHRDIIEQSITNGWQGLFPPKNQRRVENVLKTEHSKTIADALKRKADQNK
jgi:hypothetical protein